MLIENIKRVESISIHYKESLEHTCFLNEKAISSKIRR